MDEGEDVEGGGGRCVVYDEEKVGGRPGAFSIPGFGGALV